MVTGGAKTLGDLAVGITFDENKLERDLRSGEGKVKSSGSRMGAGLATGVGVGVAAVAGIGAAAIASADRMNEAYGKIQAGTGATGQQLEGLKASFHSVFGETAASADQVSGAIADLNTRFGFTGQKLEQTALQAIKFGQATGEDGVAAMDTLGRAMEFFGEDAENVGTQFDSIVAASQASGRSVGDLTGDLQKFGPVMANAGFTMDETTKIFAEMHANGVNVSRAMPGLNAAFRKAAEEGKNGKDVFNDLTATLKNTESDTEALTIATEVLGAQGAQRFLSFARAGDEAGNLITDAMNNSAGATETMYEHSLTLGDQMGILKTNLMEVAAEAVQDFMPMIMKAFDTIIPIIRDAAEFVLPLLKDAFALVLPIVSDLAEQVFPVLRDIFNDLKPAMTDIFTVLKEDLFPALMDLWNVVSPVLIPAIKILSEQLVNGLAFAVEYLTGVVKIISSVLTGDFGGAWDAVKDIAFAAMEFIVNTFNNTLGRIPGIAEIEMGKVEDTFVSVKEVAETEMPKISQAVNGVAEAVVEAADVAFSPATSGSLPATVAEGMAKTVEVVEEQGNKIMHMHQRMVEANRDRAEREEALAERRRTMFRDTAAVVEEEAEKTVLAFDEIAASISELDVTGQSAFPSIAHAATTAMTAVQIAANNGRAALALTKAEWVSFMATVGGPGGSPSALFSKNRGRSNVRMKEQSELEDTQYGFGVKRDSAGEYYKFHSGYWVHEDDYNDFATWMEKQGEERTGGGTSPSSGGMSDFSLSYDANGNYVGAGRGTHDITGNDANNQKTGVNASSRENLGLAPVGSTPPTLPGLPGFADGGIAMRPMAANIAESGPEAIIPLQKVGGTTINVIVGEGAYVVDDFVESVRDALYEIDRQGVS